jgi:hypothetical protein
VQYSLTVILISSYMRVYLVGFAVPVRRGEERRGKERRGEE